MSGIKGRLTKEEFGPVKYQYDNTKASPDKWDEDFENAIARYERQL
jgi:hypothetical protein